MFLGCIFIRCVLNKEIYDVIREVEGVGGFIGLKVGNMLVFLFFIFYVCVMV